jgi:hypothetical protein
METNYTTCNVPTNTHTLFHDYPQNGHLQGGYPQNGHLQGGYPQNVHYVAAHPQNVHYVATHPQNVHYVAAYPQNVHYVAAYPQNVHYVATHPQNVHYVAAHPQNVHQQNDYPQGGHYVAHQQGGHCDCHIQPNNSYNNFYRIQSSNGPSKKRYPTHPSQPPLNSSHPINPIPEEPSEVTNIRKTLESIGLNPRCKNLNVITTPPLPELMETPKPIEIPTSVITPKPIETPTVVITPKPIEIPTVVTTPKPIEIPTVVTIPKPIEIPTLVIAPKPQTLVFNYFKKLQTKSETKSETIKKGETPVDYVFRLLKDLFKHGLGLEFYSLWGIFYKSEASELSRQVSDRLNEVWEEMRKERNNTKKEKLIDGKLIDVKKCCWKFNCSQPHIKIPSGSPHNPFIYMFCEAHKTLVTIFEQRHTYSNNTNAELMAVSRLVHLLLPESDKVARESDHLTVTRRLCIMQLGGRLAVGKEGFPMDFHLMNLKIANPVFYEKIELFINQYKEDFPDAFPPSKESPPINVKNEESRSIQKIKRKRPPPRKRANRKLY